MMRNFDIDNMYVNKLTAMLNSFSIVVPKQTHSTTAATISPQYQVLSYILVNIAFASVARTPSIFRRQWSWNCVDWQFFYYQVATCNIFRYVIFVWCATVVCSIYVYSTHFLMTSHETSLSLTACPIVTCRCISAICLLSHRTDCSNSLNCLTFHFGAVLVGFFFLCKICKCIRLIMEVQ